MTQLTYKILVVDDEPDLEHLMRQRMRRQVRTGRYALVFAQNGVEALERLEEDPTIDMVLTDINMPRMDGLTLLKQISKVDPNIRSVVVSAYGDMQNIRTAMNRGAFDFVTKPIDFKDLMVTIDRTLHHLTLWREALASRDKLVSLQNELHVAHQMQQSILPSTFPETVGCQIYGSMEPARDVGGDFFDIINLEKGRLGLAIGDVSDKGVPAALFMMSCRTLLKGAAIGDSSPAKVLGVVNQLLEEDNQAGLFVTMFFAVFDPATGDLVYANGGHNPPLLVHADGRSDLLPSTDGIALGVVPNLTYQEKKGSLSPGDSLVLYTDGVTEAMNSDDEEFGLERLRQVLAVAGSNNARAANHAIFAAVHAFAGERPQFDDITCLTLRHNERAS